MTNKNPNIFLQSVDSSDMYAYTLKNGLIGSAIGASTTGIGMFFAHRYTNWFKRAVNVPIRSFLLFSGAAVGFTLASDWAMVHHLRYLDRPDISGFQKLKDEKEKEAQLKQLKNDYYDRLKDLAWSHRFKLIFAGWASTMAGVIYKNYRDPYMNSVHKFGHARIYAQIVTIASVILAFAFNDETGPWAEKYKPDYKRSA